MSSEVPSGGAGRDASIDAVAVDRYSTAMRNVAALRSEHPDDTPDQLADRLIRRTVREMAISGAVSGGAAAAPVAGVAAAAASAGAEAAFGAGRLGELIMGIGVIYGHDASADERSAAIATVMGLADGAAVGMSGLAARAGVKGGARVINRLPKGAAPAGAGASRRAVAKLANTKGPWSLAALIPYGIGAGVGATGNALLVRAVGRAAKEYYSGRDGAGRDEHTGPGGHEEPEVVEVIDSETELLDPEPSSDSAPGTGGIAPDDVVDADVIDAEVVEDG